MAAPLAAYGMLLLVFRGVLHTLQLSLGRAMKDWEWPYFRLMSMVCVFACLPIALVLVALKTPLPEPGHRKWVLLRGLFGAGSFFCSILAAQLDAPVGDVEALRSVNMIAAALLGRFLLDEELHKVTVLALGCSIAGAVLISQPGCLFGRHGAHESSTAWIGDILALISGACQACVFVASRKAPGTSVWVQALSSHLMSGLTAGALPMLGAIDDYSVTPLLSAPPAQVAGCFALLFGNTFLSTIMVSAAAQWCTAAESAIISTSAGMGSGFVVQTEVFGAPPNKLALAGAALMLVGVVLMALAQSRPAEDNKQVALPTVPEEEQLESGGLPLLSLETAKPIDPGLLPGASDASTCDCDLQDLEDCTEGDNQD